MPKEKNSYIAVKLIADCVHFSFLKEIELLGECKGLMKEHKLVRKEIRRWLQIDTR